MVSFNCYLGDFVCGYGVSQALEKVWMPRNFSFLYGSEETDFQDPPDRACGANENAVWTTIRAKAWSLTRCQETNSSLPKIIHTRDSWADRYEARGLLQNLRRLALRAEPTEKV